MSHKIDVAFRGTGTNRHKNETAKHEKMTIEHSFHLPFIFYTCVWIHPNLHKSFIQLSKLHLKKKKAEVVSDRLTFHHLEYLNPSRLKHFAKPKDNGLPIDLCSVQMFSCVCAKRYTAGCLQCLAADKLKVSSTRSPLLNRHKETSFDICN